MKELLGLLGIKAALSTAYHLQTDDQTERLNQEVEQYLQHFVNERQNDWSSLLPTAKFALNNWMNSLTKKSPFQIVYGYSPQVGIEPKGDAKIKKAGEFATQMAASWRETELALWLAKEDMARHYNVSRKPAPDFVKGDKVWLDASNISMTQLTKKLDVKRLGPFLILEKIGSHNYHLKLPKALFVHPTFHVSRLCPYLEDPIPEHHQKPPPPIHTKEGPAYEIEKLLDVQIRRWGHSS